MRKLLALLLALTMLLTLCACGSDDDFDNRDDDEIEDEEDEDEVKDDGMMFDPGDGTEEDPAGTETETEPETETETLPETTAEINTVAPDTEVPEDTEPTESASILGVTEGTHYENAYFGLAYDFGAEWYIANDEELAELIGVTADVIDDAVFEEALRESGFAYSIYATADEGLTTLSVGVENLGILYGLTLTEQEYIDMSEDMLVEALESVGLTNVVIEQTTVTLAGTEHPAVKVKGEIYDIELYETIVVVKSSIYIACVTASSYVTDTTAEILADFYTP